MWLKETHTSLKRRRRWWRSPIGTSRKWWNPSRCFDPAERKVVMVETVTNSVIAFIDSSNNPVYLEGVRSYSVDRVPRYIRQPWRNKSRFSQCSLNWTALTPWLKQLGLETTAHMDFAKLAEQVDASFRSKTSGRDSEKDCQTGNRTVPGRGRPRKTP